MDLRPRRVPPLFPGTPAPVMRRPRVGAFPVLPALAALMVMLAVLEVAGWLMGGGSGVLKHFMDRVFTGIETSPAWLQETPAVLAQRGNAAMLVNEGPQGPVRLHLTPRAGDMLMGDPRGATTVTLLTDPGCGACRTALPALLQIALRPNVRVVVTFWPRQGAAPDANLTGGLVMALAHAGGVQQPFWQNLMAAKGELSDADLLSLLDQSGMDFAAQRGALARNPELGQTMDHVLAQARQAHLPPPPVVAVNGLVIDGADLEAFLTPAKPTGRMPR